MNWYQASVAITNFVKNSLYIDEVIKFVWNFTLVFTTTYCSRFYHLKYSICVHENICNCSLNYSIISLYNIGLFYDTPHANFGFHGELNAE